MNLKGFLKYVLIGLLLVTPSLIAFADDVNVGDITETTTVLTNYANVGVAITPSGTDAGTIGYTISGVLGSSTFAANPDVITIGDITVGGFTDSTTTMGVVGVGVSNTSGHSLENTTINVGDIALNGSATNTYSAVSGFVYTGTSATTGLFGGTLSIGDINIVNTGTRALGVGFMHSDGAGGAMDVSGDVTVGDISVSGLNATGFYADNLKGATVLLGNINTSNTSTANDASTYAVNIGNINNGGSLTVGNVAVESNGSGATYGAIGITATIIAADGSLKAGNVTVNSKYTADTAAIGVSVGQVKAGGGFEVGTINVESAKNATGIAVGGGTDYGASELTVTKDIIATSKAAASAGATAYGIASVNGNDNLAVTIDTTDGDFRISGILENPNGNSAASINLIHGADTLTITGANAHTNKGQVFVVNGAENVTWETNANYVAGSSFTTNAATAHKVATDKTVVINGTVTTSGTYTVGDSTNNDYAGTLMVKQLTATDVTINNGTLALDGNSTHSITGTLTVGNDNNSANAPAAIAIYGNVAPGTEVLSLTSEATAKGNAVVDSNNKVKLLSLSALTEYKWDDAQKGYFSSNRASALLSDGFLLPASIHNRITAWELTRDHLISGGLRSRVGNEYRGQSPCEAACSELSCEPCDPCNSGSGLLLGTSVGRSAWVNYVGRSNDYRSSYSNIGVAGSDWQVGTDGVQVGLDLYKTKNAQLGLLFGYEGSVATLRADRLEADDVYFGVYAASVFRNGTDFRVIYNYGSQDYKLRRIDSGSGLNSFTHNSAFSGSTNEITLELGKRIYSSRTWSYRPVIGLDLLINDWNSATEDGNSSTAVRYTGTDYTQAFLRIGSDLKYAKDNFEFNSGLYYSYDLNDDKLQSKVIARNAANASSMLFGSDLGRSVLTFNVGASYAFSECTSVFGGFTGDAVLDRDGDGFQSIGYVGLKWRW
ncbi:MAG: autotransporter domain-containing protein [Planctomycetaceae bacterium]|nr:autotransporter domain-containing protein [Planctomycetaceae bacterium]